MRRALAAAAVLLLTGCGASGDDPDAGPPPGPTAGTAFEVPDGGAVGTSAATAEFTGLAIPLRRIADGPVEIEDATVTTSPGLRAERLLRSGRPAELTVFNSPRWSVRRFDDGPLIGRFPERASAAVVGVSAQQAGVYFVDGLSLTYAQDGRRRTQALPASLCVVVGARGASCRAPELPAGADVVSLGGPVYEAGARLRATDDPATAGVEAVMPGKAGVHAIEIPLTNRGDRRVTIQLQYPGQQTEGFSAMPVRQPEPVTLDAGASGFAAVQVRVRGCGTGGVRQSLTSLGAEVDGKDLPVPLAVPIAYDC